MSFKVSQSAMSSPVPLVPVPQRHSHSATVADPSMYVNEHEHCLCVCLSQCTTLACFCLKAAGGWGAGWTPMEKQASHLNAEFGDGLLFRNSMPVQD